MTEGHEPMPATLRNGTVDAAIRTHHARLASGLTERVATLFSALNGPFPHLEAARTELTCYCEAELLPHARAEEDSLYHASAELPEGRLLVAAMLAEHAALRTLIDEVFTARSPGRLIAAAGALRSLFDAHLAKENDLLIPALADAGVDLSQLVGHVHEILGPSANRPPKNGTPAVAGHEVLDYRPYRLAAATRT